MRSVKRVTFSWIFGLNEAKINQKFDQEMISSISNNVINSELYKNFLWNKKQWKADKIVFLLIYTFIIYFGQLVIPIFTSIFQILRKFGYIYQNILIKWQILEGRKIYLSGKTFFYLLYTKNNSFQIFPICLLTLYSTVFR